MNVVTRKDAIYFEKPDGGTKVWYYLFDGYEIHFNEVASGVTQQWHCHDTIDEAVLVVGGEICAEWVEDGKKKERTLREGDLALSGRWIHTFTNRSSEVARIVVFKLVAGDANRRETFKTDKRVFEAEDLFQLL